MKIILFRFEKNIIHFLECNISAGDLVIGDKEKIALEPTKNQGEKYQNILDELLKIKTKYSPDMFMYQSPQKYRGALKDEEGFASSVVLNIFSHQNNIKLFEQTPMTVREKLSIPNKDFKSLLESEKGVVLKSYPIKKSDKLFDGLLFLFVLRSYI
jgi:hypothetical protein